MPCVVFAAGLDWLEGLLPALFVGFWILSQVFAIFRRPANRGEQPQPVGRGRQPLPAPPPPPSPTEVFDDVRSDRQLGPEPGERIEMRPDDRARLEQEIEEFLAGRRRGRSPAGNQQESSFDRPPEKRSRRRGDARRPRGPGKPPRGAEPAATPPPLPAPVVSNVARPPIIDTDIARHVDEAFAHDLAHEPPLSGNDRATVASSETKSMPASLTALLRNPATIRQIVVMREVLERPTERWQ